MTTQPRYYITRPGGTPTGPLSLDSLRVMAQQGALSTDMLYCEEGGDEWKPVTEKVIIHHSRVVETPTPHVDKPDTRIVKSIVLLALGLTLCPLTFFPAVPALVYAVLSENAFTSLKYEESIRYSHSARTWVNVSTVVTFIQLLLYLVIILLLIFDR